MNNNISLTNTEDEPRKHSEETTKSTEETSQKLVENTELCSLSENAEIKLVRIQGIEPMLEIPFGWVVNNLMNPEHFLHICVYVKVAEPITIWTTIF